MLCRILAIYLKPKISWRQFCELPESILFIQTRRIHLGDCWAGPFNVETTRIQLGDWCDVMRSSPDDIIQTAVTILGSCGPRPFNVEPLWFRVIVGRGPPESIFPYKREESIWVIVEPAPSMLRQQEIHLGYCWAGPSTLGQQVSKKRSRNKNSQKAFGEIGAQHWRAAAHNNPKS